MIVFSVLASIGVICCLLFYLAVYALPLFAGVAAGVWAYGAGAGWLGGIAVGAVAGLATLLAGHLLLAFVKPLWLRLMIAAAFVAPAAIAGYHATHGIVKYTMPSETWQVVFSLVGAVPVIAKDYLPSAVVRLMRSRPDINITITEMRNSQLLPAFRKGQFDFIAGILDLEELDESFVTKILFYDELVAVVRPKHPLTRMRGGIQAKDLLRFPWIYPNRGTAHRRRMDTYFQAARLSPPIGIIVGGSHSFIKAALRESDFVAVLPEDAVRDEETRGTLKTISLDSPILRRPIGLIHRGRKTLTPIGRALMLEVERACRMKALAQTVA